MKVYTGPKIRMMKMSVMNKGYKGNMGLGYTNILVITLGFTMNTIIIFILSFLFVVKMP